MTVPAIDLSRKQSTTWHYLEDSETTEILFGGAAGPGKSYLGCIWHIYRRTRYPNTRGIIGRAKLSNLKQSTLVTFFKVAGIMGYRAGKDYSYNAQDHIITWENGSVTHFKDLFYYPSDPDFNSLGSTEYTDAFIDEAVEITKKAYEIVNSRLRWKISELGLIPKTLLTCNPGPGWVKETFVKDKDGDPVVLKPYQKFVPALATDNPDPEFVKLYLGQLQKMTSEYDKRRLIFGDWDAAREVVNPFAHQYDPKRHESTDAVRRDGLQLLISIDFNLNPFACSFAHMWRDAEGEHFHIFDKIIIEHGSLQKMIDQIRAKYRNQLHNCILTGDSVGNNSQLGRIDNASYYQQIAHGLKLKSNQVVVPHNPIHAVSREDVNYVLANFPDFKINPSACSELCTDMRIVECDMYGDKVQIRKGNREHEAERADFLDTLRYYVNTFLKQWIYKHQRNQK